MAKTIEEGEVPEGLELVEREGMGRVLVATRSFAAGEVFFAERPLIVLSDCLVVDNPSGNPELGPIMTGLGSMREGIQLDMDKICSKFSTFTPEELARLSSLDALEGHSDFVAGRLADEVAALAVKTSTLKDATRQEDLAHFLRVVSVNAHTVPRARGAMLFFWLSMFAHSCSPNATYSTDQTASDWGSFKAAPRALRSIEKGEVVTMGYLGLQMTLTCRRSRRELLRVQKGFLCCCDRCLAEDLTRTLPCPTRGCGSVCVPQAASVDASPPSDAEDPRIWQCEGCHAVIEEAKLPLPAEQKLFDIFLKIPLDSEQTIHSLMVILTQDLGERRGAEEQHFLWAWLLLHLVQILVKAARAEKKKDPKMRLATRAASVLWPLHAWVRKRVPGSLHLLGLECAVPIVRELLATDKTLEARAIAEVFLDPTRFAMGNDSADAKVLREALAFDVPKEAEGAALPTVTSCNACGRPLQLAIPPPALCRAIPADAAGLGDSSDAATAAAATAAAGSSAAAAAARVDLPAAEWCHRCGLAAFCNEACHASTAASHGQFCITFEGPPS